MFLFSLHDCLSQCALPSFLLPALPPFFPVPCVPGRQASSQCPAPDIPICKEFDSCHMNSWNRQKIIDCLYKKPSQTDFSAFTSSSVNFTDPLRQKRDEIRPGPHDYRKCAKVQSSPMGPHLQQQTDTHLTRIDTHSYTPCKTDAIDRETSWGDAWQSW